MLRKGSASVRKCSVFFREILALPAEEHVSHAATSLPPSNEDSLNHAGSGQGFPLDSTRGGNQRRKTYRLNNCLGSTSVSGPNFRSSSKSIFSISTIDRSIDFG